MGGLLSRFGFSAAGSPAEAGRVVVITGCDSGFGSLLAIHASTRLNFRVVAACFTSEGTASMREKLADRDGVAVQADLTTESGRAAVIAAVESAAGDSGIWALVNNAGIALPGNIEWAQPSSYERTMAINFHTPVHLTYALLPSIKKARGRVINVTSVDGFIPLPSNAAYNASKHALEAYSDTLRVEMRPWGVDVVVIEPATMRTPLAMSFFDAWLKSFKDAPADRQAPYGNQWAERIAQEGGEGLAKIAADPMETVLAMGEALTASNPRIRYKTGKMARYFFQPLSWLPDGLRDRALGALFFRGAPPAALANK